MVVVFCCFCYGVVVFFCFCFGFVVVFCCYSGVDDFFCWVWLVLEVVVEGSFVLIMFGMVVEII